MKIKLCCAAYTVDGQDNHEYWRLLGTDSYYLEMNVVLILPVGTIVYITDEISSLSVSLEVICLWYVLEEETMYLNVDIEGTEMSPEEFIQYLERSWTK
jgi:hypothetical protein